MLNCALRKSQGDDIANPVTRKWRMTSQLERRGEHRWYKPLATLLGKFGEPNGPTIEQVRLGAQLRKAFKDGMGWEAPLEPPTPPDLSAPVERHASITVTSGRRRWSKPPPIDRYDGPDSDILNDNIPF